MQSPWPLPGRLVHRPWVDFGTNRSEAIELARGDADYLLIIDADDQLVVDRGFTKRDLRRQLRHDAHRLLVVDAGLHYERLHLLATHLPWRYEGVLHEYAACDTEHSDSLIEGMRYHRIGGGARSGDPTKYQRDVEILRAALKRRPNHPRDTFYLAQSHRDAGQFAEAIDVYRQRATLGGWSEEIWYSLFQVARLLDHTESAENEVVGAYLEAHDHRPQRAEALVHLCGYLRRRQRWPSAWLFAQEAVEIPRPNDRLFLSEDVYQWRAVDEYAIAAYWHGQYGLSAQACRQLLDGNQLPLNQTSRVRTNLDWAIAKLSPTVSRKSGETKMEQPSSTASVVDRKPVRCIAVLGPWRGGTSLVTGILQQLGAQLGGPFYEAGTGYPTYEDQDLRNVCLRCHGESEHHWRRLTTPQQSVDLLRQWLDLMRRRLLLDRDASDPSMIAAKHPLLCLLVGELITAWSTPSGEAPLLISVRRPAKAVFASWDRPQHQGGAPWWPRNDRDFVVRELINHRDAALQNRPHLAVDFEKLRSKPNQEIQRIADFCDFSELHVQSAVSLVRAGG